MSWYHDSLPGKVFQALFTNKGLTTLGDMQTWIFAKTRINPNVIKDWTNGGNPSMTNLEKILNALVADGTIKEFDKDNLMSKTKTWKISKLSISNEMVTLKAFVNEYQASSERFWVRCYNGNKFVHGDRITSYRYAPNLVKTPEFIQRVCEKLGHDKFLIEFDEKLSSRFKDMKA